MDGRSAPLSHRRRTLALVSILLSTLAGTIDASIVNVALPRLSVELGASASTTVWVTTAFLLATACAVPATSAFGDQIGRRRMYLIGVPVFTSASLGCALSPSVEWLIAFRTVQGLGFAVILAVAIPLFRQMFPAAELGRVLGLNAMTVALGTSAGPTLGGLILEVLPWPWIFLINVPIGLVSFVLAWFVLPRTPPERGDYDWPGALLAAAALAALLLGMRQLSDLGTLWHSGVLLAAFAVCVVIFIRHERRAVRPLIPLGLFTARFSLAVATAWATFLGQGIVFVLLPFLFQNAYGETPLQSALLFTPWPLLIVFIAPVAGRLADHIDPVRLALAGLIVLTGGLAMLALLGAGPPLWLILLSTAVCGLGFGVFQSPNNRDMMAAAPLRHAASASAVLNTNRTVGQTIGSAIVGVALVISGAHGDTPVEQAQAASAVLWLGVAAGGIAALIAWVRMRRTAGRA